MKKQKTHEGLPLYNISVDNKEGDGMDYISLVKNPATEQPFFKFKKQEKKNKELVFATDDEKQLVTGVVMLADTPIYRRGEEGEEFYAQFPKEVVEKMSFKYMKNKFTDRVNLEHNRADSVEGAYLVESFLFDKERGIKIPEFIGEVPEGSWIATFKIEDEEVWKKVKSGEFSGFSLEADLGLEMAFGKKDFTNSLKNSILDKNLSVQDKYNKIVKAVSND